MSIPVDKLSMFGALAPLREQPDNNGIRESGVFSEKFEKALASREVNVTDANIKARELAESLTLQMMQSSLDLSGNPASESSHLSNSSQYSSVNSFLQAYRANLPAGGESNLSSTSHSFQLQELAGTNPADASSEAMISRSHDNTEWLDPIISKASQKYGVEVGLIRAVIKAESDFNPQAVSHAGASGLMQLMPATARSLGVSDSFDPEQNVMAGTRYLKDMLQRYGGNVDAALAAYNWGPGNVDRHPDQLPRETRDYLARVKGLYASYNG